LGSKGFALRLDFLHTALAQEIRELAAHHAHAHEDHGLLRLGAGGFEAHVEIIEDGEEGAQQVAVGIGAGFLGLAGGTFAEVVQLRLAAVGQSFQRSISWVSVAMGSSGCASSTELR
jgi:hypothetical protein